MHSLAAAELQSWLHMAYTHVWPNSFLGHSVRLTDLYRIIRVFYEFIWQGGAERTQTTFMVIDGGLSVGFDIYD